MNSRPEPLLLSRCRTTAERPANPFTKESLAPVGRESVMKALANGDLEGITAMGKAAIVPLTMIFLNSESAIRRAIPQALAMIGEPEAKNILMHAVSDDDKFVCWKAMQALGQIAERNPDADWEDVAQMMRRILAGEEGPWLRNLAAESLGRMRYLGAADELLEATREKSPKRKCFGNCVRSHAIEALRKIIEKYPGRDWGNALPVFAELLKESDSEFKWSVMKAASLIAEAQPHHDFSCLMPALLEEAKTGDFYMRVEAVKVLRALVKHDPKVATPKVLELIDPRRELLDSEYDDAETGEE